MSQNVRKQMIEHLSNLGVSNAIADKNASVDGSPAILLRWNGQEEYYTGFDMDWQNPQADYQKWLKRTFAS